MTVDDRTANGFMWVMVYSSVFKSWRPMLVHEVSMSAKATRQEKGYALLWDKYRPVPDDFVPPPLFTGQEHKPTRSNEMTEKKIVETTEVTEEPKLVAVDKEVTETTTKVPEHELAREEKRVSGQPEHVVKETVVREEPVD